MAAPAIPGYLPTESQRFDARRVADPDGAFRCCVLSTPRIELPIELLLVVSDSNYRLWQNSETLAGRITAVDNGDMKDYWVDIPTGLPPGIFTLHRFSRKVPPATTTVSAADFVFQVPDSPFNQGAWSSFKLAAGIPPVIPDVLTDITYVTALQEVGATWSYWDEE